MFRERSSINSQLETAGSTRRISHSRAVKVAALLLTAAAASGCANSKPAGALPLKHSPAATVTAPIPSATTANTAPVTATPPQNKKPTRAITVTPPNQVVDNTNYYYVGGMQSTKAEGASVRLSQDQPFTQPGEHSLMELAVESQDSKQIVEVGWTVDETGSTDDKARLFVFHWVDGQGTCYDGCDFVSTSDSVLPGDPIDPGTSAIYGIQHGADGWEIMYNKREIGYFPDSLWDNRFQSAGLVQAFGEIATNTVKPCSDMGNGDYGNSRSAAQISNFTLIDSSVQSDLAPYATNPSIYSYGDVTNTGMFIGGPGAC